MHTALESAVKIGLIFKSAAGADVLYRTVGLNEKPAGTLDAALIYVGKQRFIVGLLEEAAQEAGADVANGGKLAQRHML